MTNSQSLPPELTSVNTVISTRKGAKSVHSRYRVLLLSFAVIAVVALLLSSSAVSAAGVKIIRGYAKDSAGRILDGANIVLKVWTPSHTLRFTDSFVADETGFYSFTLASMDNEFQDGDTFEVISNYNGAQHNASKVDDLNPLQWINITYPYEIPQFGSLLGFGIAAGAIGLVAMVFVVKRKKN